MTREIRLGRIFERRKILGYVEEPMLSVYRERGVVYKDEELNHNVTAEDRGIYQLVEPGWLVVNRMKAWQGSVGISQIRGIVSGHYICFRPMHGEDHRYLHYLLRSGPTTARFLSISRGVRPGQIEIDNDELAATHLSLPGVVEQRRIADFLDDRVARIDQMIEARTEQTQLGYEAFRSFLEARLWGGVRTLPLKRLLADVTSGPRGWGDLAGTGGTPFVRITNLSASGIELQRKDLANVSVPDDSESRRAALAIGDVLLSITAVFGEVAVWREGQGAFSQHVARLRPVDIEDADWMAWVLQTTSAHDQYRLSAYGGTKIGMGLDQVRNLFVPDVSKRERQATVSAIAAAWDRHQGLSSTLQRGVDLLTEYKQALITAAVTGQLDVTAAGNGVSALGER
jgi:type I restriction enzyme S subunit